MRDKVCIDIILPVYNSEKFICNALKSVYEQTHKNWKLIIIDDASTDNTSEILANSIKKRKNKKILLLKNRFNKGQAFSRNKGLKYSKSRFIAFLDSDDTWDKNKLKKQINFMLTNNYDFTYTDYKIIKNNDIKLINVPESFNYKKFLSNTSITTSTIILNKKVIKNIYFKNLKFLEDYFFKCEILKKNITAYKCPGVFSSYLIRNNSLQSNRLLVLLYLWKINKNLNKMKFLNNIFYITNIILNSLKKYGIR